MIDYRQITINAAASFVAAVILATMAFIAWALVYKEIPKGNETTLVQFVGALQALAGLIVGYFFGSSHTNKRQTDTIDTLSKAAATQGPQITAHPGDTIRSESSTQTETRID